MIAVIIQARMGSTRLPGKVLKEIDGKPLLKYQIDRIKQSKFIDKIIIATSVLKKDDPIMNFCIKNHIEYFRGSENDVLDRYYNCAKKYDVNTIVRLTADCPLSDPEVIDKTIDLFESGGFDYVANTVPPETSKYPDGSDVEVFSMQSLERAFNEATSAKDREHVTFYFWKYDNGFKKAQLDDTEDFSKYRFTLDYPEDFEVIDFIIQELKKKNIFGHLPQIVEILKENPKINEKNSKYYSGIGWGDGVQNVS